MSMPEKNNEIPDFSLIVLIGSTGSGKSTFAAKQFLPTEVISSDYCRALVSDRETDQGVTGDAFDLVREIARKRLKRGNLAVIDATNVRLADRKGWIELARQWHALPIAIVFDPGNDVCIERNKARSDRAFGGQVVQRMVSEVRRGLGGLQREGFRQVWKLASVECIEAANVTRQPLLTDKRNDHGPFDIIGDIYGCADELQTLLTKLGTDWAARYRGSATIVYGHTPVVRADWVNNTLCIDTGCVFGGKLTALRWPEKELVDVPAERTWFEPIRPLGSAMDSAPTQADADHVLDISDVSGRRWIDTELKGRIVVAEVNAAAALEVMCRFALAPQWLAYLPLTMSPSETSEREGWLERPEEAFAHFRERGVGEVVCEEKHMGSRAVIALRRAAKTAKARFGVTSEETGAIWTRTGRP